PVAIDGRTATIGSQRIELPGVPKTVGANAGAGSIELGIRPEYVRLGRDGMAVKVSKVEDVGRHKVVRASLEGREIAAVIGEDDTVPADPKVRFDPAGINIYADSWRVEMGA
ncbi:MAG: TOBE domain-containing protein, partial [Mesorhizobium sp.]